MPIEEMLTVKEVTGKELLTIEEMAAFLKVPRSWIYSRSRIKGSEAIPRVRIGKYLRFNPGAVMEWIEKQYGEAAQ